MTDIVREVLRILDKRRLVPQKIYDAKYNTFINPKALPVLPPSPWVAAATPNNAWAEVVYGNGVFLARGTDKMMKSEDGLTWTEVSKPSQMGANNFNSRTTLSYCNGYFFIIHNNAPVEVAIRSEDGVTWYDIKDPLFGLQGDLFPGFVVYGNGSYIVLITFLIADAVAVNLWDTSFNYSYASFLPEYSERKSTIFHNGLFYVLTTIGLKYYTSPDAVTWTEHVLPASQPFDVRKLVYNEFINKFMCIGSDGTGYQVWLSDDYATWTKVKAGYEYTSIAYSPNIIVATTTTTIISTSYDGGVTWTDTTVTPTSNNSVDYGDSLFVAVNGTASSGALSSTGQYIEILDLATKAQGDKADTALQPEDFTPETLGDLINSASAKATPIDADLMGLVDTEDSFTLKKFTFTNLKAFLKTYFDTLYNLYVHPNHSGDVTSVGDGAQTIAEKAVTLAKMADVAESTVFYRKTSGDGSPEVQTLTTLATDLDPLISGNIDGGGPESIYLPGDIIDGGNEV